MITRWPSNWKHALLRELDIPVTQYALDVLSSWHKSTPVMPWTNNPLGLGAREHNKPEALGTPYAVFSTMKDFRSTMVRVSASTAGKKLVKALRDADKYSTAWHAIQGLNTPGRHTEEDYPIHVLHLASKAYEEHARKPRKGAPKTTGVVNPQVAPTNAVREINRALYHAAANMTDHRKAIAHIVKKGKEHG